MQRHAATPITTGSGSRFRNDVHELARAFGDEVLLAFTNRF
jgi:hypothetical protein